VLNETTKRSVPVTAVRWLMLICSVQCNMVVLFA
jgi:hypothetical protein